MTELGVVGANPNPMFTAMAGVNQLREIGYRPTGRGAAPWARPALANPAPVQGMPRGLALLPAVAAMLRWKLRRRDR